MPARPFLAIDLLPGVVSGLIVGLVSRFVAGLVLALGVGLALPACYAPIGARDVQHDAGCPGPAVGERVRWRKRLHSSAAASLIGSPHHTATDPIVNPGHDAHVHGKFAYGLTSKDLIGEDIGLWLRMRPCGEWREVARGLTDGDGRVAMTVPAQLISRPGAYPYQMVVRGDLTRAHGAIYVLEPGTRVALFDIDGTLTESDRELLAQLTLGADPDMRAGANHVVNRYAQAGYLPVFMTGRPYLLRRATRSWLRRNRFPPGPLITTDNLSDAQPGHAHVGKFKKDALERLTGVGLDIAYAYGNADTDVCAYARAGIDPQRTFIAASEPTRCDEHEAAQPVPDYIEHLRTLTLPPTR